MEVSAMNSYAGSSCSSICVSMCVKISLQIEFGSDSPPHTGKIDLFHDE